MRVQVIDKSMLGLLKSSAIMIVSQGQAVDQLATGAIVWTQMMYKLFFELPNGAEMRVIELKMHIEQ